ncbi:MULTISPECIES: tRNA (adenine(22)-N(1))-methyltransferase [Thermoanaerobacter]|uniref:tRNA (adenine(22)-N(1))-methyltransferase n=1 Tax=Thermoanaerobacter TaxID=1754 RepID=UPI000574B78E|nr:class I SAM-dependent methyltransferase [Thermoanaerobacter sp. YS13]KHO62891.1 SAM-dependent methyltransferase [Thermoanaerobacter sp. YS13]
MKLTERLRKIAEYIPHGSKVADIGTDHGFIPVYLIENKISTYVVASDLNKGSLSKAVKEVEKRNLQSLIDTRLGNGLNVLSPGEVDIVVIAGMGGISITKILDEGKNIAKTIKKFIFQPMRDSADLRKYLIENGYKISDEELVKENQKYYEIIVAEHGRQKVKNHIYYEVGEKLLQKRHPLLEEFLQYKIDKMKKIISKLPESNEKRKQLEEKVKKFEVLINGLEMPSNSFHNG